MKADFLPQRQQRLTTRVENFGLVSERVDLTICASVAIVIIFSSF
jgi:hypothetical protein